MFYDWRFVCQDFRETLKHIDDLGELFIYCDPPYIGRHVDYYDSWDMTDERALYEMLKQSDKKFMVSTWIRNKFRVNPFVDDIWKICRKITQEHFYHVGAKEHRHSIIEAVLMNY